MIKDRYLTSSVCEDLKEKMVFLGGARQVGKTTFATQLVSRHFRSRYYNWDKIPERRDALKGVWPADVELIILDEFHKHRKWKTWIKGEYDSLKSKFNFLLTGSARLDIYRRGGDSLQGRYHYYRLHPLTVAELGNRYLNYRPQEELRFSEALLKDEFESLFYYGGFPEPFLRQDERHLRRWQNERLERFFKEDIRDLTQIHDFGHLALLAELLPERVGSILSINALAEDLQVNFRTVANWLDVFENFYYCFRLAPYQSRKIASVRKEKKLYLWDWSELKSEGAKLENLVASHLLKFCHYLHDCEGWKVDLHYLRDHTGREVDFLVSHDHSPWFAVEVKNGERSISRELYYFRDKLKIPYCYQVNGSSESDYFKDGVRVLHVSKFLSALV